MIFLLNVYNGEVVKTPISRQTNDNSDWRFKPINQYKTKRLFAINKTGIVKLKTDNLGANCGEINGKANPSNNKIAKIILIKNINLFIKDSFFIYLFI